MKDEEIIDETLQNDSVPNTHDTDDIDETIEMDEEFVDLDDEGNEKSLQQKNKELRQIIKKLEAEKKEYLDGWKRAQADAINKEKIHQEDRVRTIGLANKRLMADLLPVMDSFLSAMANKEVWESIDSKWRIGVEYIKSQLQSVFENNNLVIFGAVGDVADPTKYNSLETVVTDDESKDGTVATILQYGYTLSGTVIREAKCKTYTLEQK